MKCGRSSPTSGRMPSSGWSIDLLASPHYGERWGRHWLDVVRFAETNGYERDALKPGAWRYRDWVIDAFNDDMPYDRFVVEQLAGDEIARCRRAARGSPPGFLRVGTFDDEPNDPAKYKFEQLDDLMHATSTAFLAVTLKCARCHDHKFDPIPQTDYYAVLNFFAGGKPAEGELLAFTDAGPERRRSSCWQAAIRPTRGETVAAGLPVDGLARASAETAAPERQRSRPAGDCNWPSWITDPRNPLTARVMVNRLWQHHFGEGLVRTPDNFGTMGDEPTHPDCSIGWPANWWTAAGGSSDCTS